MNNKYVVWIAICLHWVWGTLLLMSPDPLGVTAIYTSAQVGMASAMNLGMFYLIVAASATIGLIAPKYVGYFFLAPQQIALGVASYGAAHAMVTGTFADGVVRSTAFLTADQLPIILLAVFHFSAVYLNCMFGGKPRLTA